MNATKHTPGPWDITPNGSAIYDDKGTVICLLETEVASIPEAEANARLIKQAPALLKALQSLQKVIREAGLLDSKKYFNLCLADALACNAVHEATKEG